MARLSGMASEHHPNGAGDGPNNTRRRRGGRGKLLSAVAGTKRAASPSDDGEAKRTKHGGQPDDHDQLNRELDESVSRSQPADTPAAADVAPRPRRHSDTNTTVTTTARQSRTRIRMSMPAAFSLAAADGNEGPSEVNFAPLRQVLDDKMGRRLRRNHLSEEMNDIEDSKKREVRMRKQYAKLAGELKDKENLIKTLEEQLETQRLSNLDVSEDRTSELQLQLDEARQAIGDLRASSAYADGDDTQHAPDFDDDDSVVFVDQEETTTLQRLLEASPLPTGYYASRALNSNITVDEHITLHNLSSVTDTTRDVLAAIPEEDDFEDAVPGPHGISDKAVQRYDMEITDLMHQLADSRSALRCITIELQNLDLLAPGGSAKEILAQLRLILDNGRRQYETLFSGSARTTIGLTNTQFLSKIFEEFKGMNVELLDKTKQAEKLNQRSRLVHAQYENVLDVLAGSEDRNANLEADLKELRTDNAELTEQLSAIQNQFELLSAENEQQRQQIEGQDAEINVLKDVLEAERTSLERMTEAMEQYREKTQSLAQTVTRLEEEHAAQISTMEEDHEDVVADLKAQLDAETADRDEAEREVQQKDKTIEELEAKMDELDTTYNTVYNQVQDLEARLAETEEAYETAEGARAANENLVYDRDNTIENLSETLEASQAELAQFRLNLDGERSQRQQTEADLEAANESIGGLAIQLRDQGIQANELRSKLFQVQQEREAKIAQLEEDAKALEEHYEIKTRTEFQLRTDAETEVSELQAQVVRLEKELSTTEEELKQTTLARDAVEADRNEIAARLHRQLEDLRKKYTALEASSKSSIDTLQAAITDLTNDLTRTRNHVEDLEHTAVETAEQHAAELADREEQIAALEAHVHGVENEIAASLKENADLSDRLEAQALETINIVESNAQHVQHLNDAIALHTATIANLKNTAEREAISHTEEITQKEAEIEELTLIGSARAETIIQLEAEIENLQEALRTQADDSANTINAMLDKNRQNIAEQEQLAADTKRRTAEIMQSVADMKAQGVHIRTNGINLNKVVSGKVTKVTDNVKISKRKSRGGRKKSIRESGFFEMESSDELAGDADEMADELADEAVLE